MIMRNRKGIAHLELEKWLREKIRNNEFSPDIPICTEPELEKQFGISRKSVRKAVQHLVDDGLLIKRQGIGTFVVSQNMHLGVQTAEIKILFMSQDVTNASEYSKSLLERMAEYSFQTGYKLMFGDFRADEKELLADWRNKKFDGIIWDLPRQAECKIRNLADAGVPQVTVNHHVDGVSRVYCDNKAELFESVKFLFECGHRKIAFLNYNLECEPYITRRRAFEEAVARYCEEKAVYDNSDSTKAALSVKRILEQKPSALIIGGHALLVPVLIELERVGLKVKEDISIICLNDSFSAKGNLPPISVFTEPREEVGSKAVQMLAGIISGKFPAGQQLMLKGDLIIRDSCKIIR
jgi:LacI family repressor for deo operon, udp, cdd, tsx, nupC, and nupG